MPLWQIRFSGCRFCGHRRENDRGGAESAALSVDRFVSNEIIMECDASPLFEPVLWEGSGFKILDESLIPERIEYIPVSEIPQALQAVRDMRTRAFGQVLTFLYSGALVAQRYDGNPAEPLREKIEELTR